MKPVVLKIFVIAAVVALLLLGKETLLVVKNWFDPDVLLSGTSLEILQRENTALRIELENLLSFKQKILHFTPESVVVPIHALYPYNLKNELTIGAGANKGFKNGMAVVADNLLVGIIHNVFQNTSVVQTIFDPRFEIPVQIGAKGIKALLKGGNNPVIALIPREADLQAGDGVYSISADFPFGLAIGEIKQVSKQEGDAWITADLFVPYSLEDLNFVSVITNFK